MRKKQSNQNSCPTDLITPEQAAEILQISVAALQMRRMTGKPPCYYKLGPGRASHVRYSRRHVLDYLISCLQEPSNPDQDDKGG